MILLTQILENSKSLRIPSSFSTAISSLRAELSLRRRIIHRITLNNATRLPTETVRQLLPLPLDLQCDRPHKVLANFGFKHYCTRVASTLAAKGSEWACAL